MNIGDKVRPSKQCRNLYGDPDILTIVEIRESIHSKYLTDIYPDIWFEKYELEKIYEVTTAQEVLKELDDMETYTREEVYEVARRCMRTADSSLNDEWVAIYINSEIDTVKIF